MKTPKEKLKEIYDEYLKDNKTYHFWGWLNNIYYKDIIENVTILITSECGFSTTSECRKAINELESQELKLKNNCIVIEEGKKSKLQVKRLSDGVIFPVQKYIYEEDSNEHHIWCNGWYGHHRINGELGGDCEWI